MLSASGEDVVPVGGAAGGHVARTIQSQHGQHGVAPELPVHAQRGAAGEAARQQVVVRQPVGVRAPGLDHAPAGRPAPPAPPAARRAAARARRRQRRRQTGVSQRSPIAGDDGQVGHGRHEVLHPAEDRACWARRAPPSGPAICTSRKAPGARSTSAPGPQPGGGVVGGTGGSGSASPARPARARRRRRRAAAAPPERRQRQRGHRHGEGGRDEGEGGPQQLAVAVGRAGCSSSGPGTRSCSARAAGGGCTYHAVVATGSAHSYGQCRKKTSGPSSAIDRKTSGTRRQRGRSRAQQVAAPHPQVVADQEDRHQPGVVLHAQRDAEHHAGDDRPARRAQRLPVGEADRHRHRR